LASTCGRLLELEDILEELEELEDAWEDAGAFADSDDSEDSGTPPVLLPMRSAMIMVQTIGQPQT
jgi:hypothetical protein